MKDISFMKEEELLALLRKSTYMTRISKYTEYFQRPSEEAKTGEGAQGLFTKLKDRRRIAIKQATVPSITEVEDTSISILTYTKRSLSSSFFDDRMQL